MDDFDRLKSCLYQLFFALERQHEDQVERKRAAMLRQRPEEWEETMRYMLAQYERAHLLRVEKRVFDILRNF